MSDRHEFDPCLITILAQRVRNGQSFKEIYDENHAALLALSTEERKQVEALAKEASKKAPSL